MLSRPTGREGALGGGDGLVDLGAAAQRNDAAALAGRRIEDRRRAGKKRRENKAIEAGIPKGGHRFWDKNPAQAKDAKQPSVGEARNGCLASAYGAIDEIDYSQNGDRACDDVRRSICRTKHLPSRVN